MSPADDDKQQIRVNPRLLLYALLRSTLIVIILLVLYYLLPLNRSLDFSMATQLLISLVLISGVFTWQIHKIIDSDHPRLRVIEALATILPLFILLFSFTYFLIAGNDSSSFSEPLSRNDALYFTITVFSTVGFGDITPKSDLGRVVTMTQMVLDVVAIGVLVKTMLGAAQVALQRRTDNEGRTDNKGRTDNEAGPDETHHTGRSR